MAKALWNGRVIAESDRTQIVDGYTYFPPDSVQRDLLRSSPKHTTCGWKGTADYFDVVVGDEVNANAAWTYPRTSEAARHIEGWIGFWNGVRVET